MSQGPFNLPTDGADSCWPEVPHPILFFLFFRVCPSCFVTIATRKEWGRWCTHTLHTQTHTQKWTVNSPPVVSGALNGLGWWPNQNECIYPPTIHLAFSSSFFFLLFFPCWVILLVCCRHGREHVTTKKKKKKLFRMAQKWWMRCKNEQDMHHERQSNSPSVGQCALLHYKQDSLWAPRTHENIYIYIYHIFGNDCATRHRWFVRTPSYNLVSYLGNAKAHWTLFLFVFSLRWQKSRKRSRMKRNKKKRGIKKIGVGDVRGQNWNPGQPALVVASSFRKFVV